MMPIVICLCHLGCFLPKTVQIIRQHFILRAECFKMLAALGVEKVQELGYIKVHVLQTY